MLEDQHFDCMLFADQGPRHVAPVLKQHGPRLHGPHREKALLVLAVTCNSHTPNTDTVRRTTIGPRSQCHSLAQFYEIQNPRVWFVSWNLGSHSY